MAPDVPVLSVIIVSYNTKALTLQCLRDLYADPGAQESDVWVVDNASGDDSVESIRETFPQVNIIENDRNVGFGAANNLAMRRARGEFFLLLNSDAFVSPGALAALIACARAHPEAAIIGPRLLNSDGSRQTSCYRFPSPGRAWLENLWLSALLKNHPIFGDYRRWSHDTEREVDSVIGACMLVRRRAFDETGGFDERYFMYQEETDWQKTLRERGWKVIFTPTATVTHLGGASGAGETARISNQFFDSLDYYEWKHHGLIGIISLRIAMVIGCLVRAILWTVVMLDPRRRELATSKARLHSWLTIRQATRWRVALKSSKQ